MIEGRLYFGGPAIGGGGVGLIVLIAIMIYFLAADVLGLKGDHKTITVARTTLISPEKLRRETSSFLLSQILAMTISLWS